MSTSSSSGRAEVSAEQTRSEEQLIAQAVSSFDQCADPRLKEIMQSLTKHLHNFIRDVRLTEDEWWKGIHFLTEAGHITDDNRQEFILLSDVLGASMQMITVDNPLVSNATEATVFGPFFVEDAPQVELGGDVAGIATGVPCWVEGTVVGIDGEPVPAARIEVWESDDEGLYDVQHDDHRVAGRAYVVADDAGAFRFWAIVPTPYPVPDDGPVGKMLRAVGRSPWRPAHLHFMVTSPGYRRLVTHFFPQDDSLPADAVFGVKKSLIKDFASQPAGTPTPDGRDLDGGAWAKANLDIVLAPANTASADTEPANVAPANTAPANTEAS